MSLTAHLLFREPTRLPKGRIRTHNLDSQRRDAPTADQVEHAARNTQTRLANVEKVFNAIAAGHCSTVPIEDATGLSKSTVQKALHGREDWPGGGRIVRTRGVHKPHQFRIFDDNGAGLIDQAGEHI